jgi:hypothetical protein
VLGIGRLKSCLGRIVLGLLLVATAYAGWRWGHVFFPQMTALFSTEESALTQTVSPEVAEATMDRFEAFRRGEIGGESQGRLSLSAGEIESVLRYSVPGLIPAGIAEPRIEMADGVMTLKARVAVETFPEMPDLNAVLGFLPDTLAVSFEGALAPLDDERWDALVVHDISVGIIPLPDRMIPEILQAIGREYVGGLADDALAIPLPDGVESAYIVQDSLVLVSDR